MTQEQLKQNPLESEKVGPRGMRVFMDKNGTNVEICKTCQEGSHKEFFMSEGLYAHELEEDVSKRLERGGDCKNTDILDGRTEQCKCGFFGIFKDGKWQDWDELKS